MAKKMTWNEYQAELARRKRNLACISKTVQNNYGRKKREELWRMGDKILKEMNKIKLFVWKQRPDKYFRFMVKNKILLEAWATADIAKI